MTDLTHETFAPKPDISDLTSLAIMSLQTAMEALQACPHPDTRVCTIPPEALTPDGAQSFIEANLAVLAPNHPALYRISLTGDLNLERVLQAFDTGRKNSPDRSYARRHGPRSSVLYVGRSSAIKKRIKEHLGFGSRQTYALNLASWARPLDVPLLLEWATYDPVVSSSTLSHLEDALWSSSMPMFGRQGSL